MHIKKLSSVSYSQLSSKNNPHLEFRHVQYLKHFIEFALKVHLSSQKFDDLLSIIKVVMNKNCFTIFTFFAQLQLFRQFKE